MVFPVQRGDDVRITYAGSTAPTNVRARFEVIYDDGSRDELSVRIDSFTTDRTPQTLAGVEGGATAKRAGTIVSGIVGFGGDLKRGQFYVTVDLFRDAEAFANLCRDYIYGLHTLPLGVFVPPGPGGGEGLMRVISLGDPAAGSDYTAEPVPANARWKVRGFSGELATDATGVNRRANLSYTDGTNKYGGSIHQRNHTADLNIEYIGSIGAYFEGGSGFLTNKPTAFSLPDTFMSEADEFAVVTEALQAGDNWGEGFIQVEEWIEL